MGAEIAREPSSVEVSIDDLSHDGRGVGRVDGKVVFVEDALPGERVVATVFSKRRQVSHARCVKVLEAALDRVEPRCQHFGTCAGCSLQHLAPAAQRQFKLQGLLENLKRLGDVEPETIFPTIEGPSWNYRRRGRLSVRHVPKKGRVVVGFRERKPRMVADLEMCHVLQSAFGDRIVALRELVDRLSCSDRIPQIEVSAGVNRQAIVIRHLEPLTDVDRATLIAFGNEHRFDVYLQAGRPDRLEPLGDYPALEYDLPEFGLTLEFSPTGFVQVNAQANRNLVVAAIDHLELKPTDRVLDLFCGLGNFSLPIATRAASLVGVEFADDLVALAERNAERNGLTNTQFLTADLSQVPPASLFQAIDKVLVDPPRSGAAAVIPGIVASDIRRLVYVSCHPATLARDAGDLVRAGFKLSGAGIADLFAHTTHAEALAVFERC